MILGKRDRQGVGQAVFWLLILVEQISNLKDHGRDYARPYVIASTRIDDPGEVPLGRKEQNSSAGSHGNTAETKGATRIVMGMQFCISRSATSYAVRHQTL